MKIPVPARLLTCLALAGSMPLARAASSQYFFSDATAGGAAGTGVFTIDIGSPLGDYHSTDTAGGGSTFGTWQSVSFRASAGTIASLVITNLVDASFTIAFPGIGGGEISPGSQADLEWQYFLTQANANGYQITPVPGIVPEASTWLSGIGLALAGGLVLRRKR